jgi:succinylarginine dihydrolase
MNAVEINFDALVGPTHNYAGLAHGNLASQRYGQTVSNPKAAALEGLAKMKLLADLGVPQAVLPPQKRPNIGALRQIGFGGSDAEVLDAARRTDPIQLAACSSASSMWAANAATVSPSADAADGKVHFTPANLIGQLHRSLETRTTAAVLRAIFSDSDLFIHHSPLPSSLQLGDEGAANHTRLAMAHDAPGIEIFVYGRAGFDTTESLPAKFPARQTREASAAIARLHRLAEPAALFFRQNLAAIDAGVFHNDVIAVGHLNVLLCHELAFADTPSALRQIRDAFARRCGDELNVVVATQKQLPLDEAIRTYLFNSQIVSMPDSSMALIAPQECAESDLARRFIEEIIAADNPIRSVHFVDIRQSMCNGGGPACLRLRVPVTQRELSKIHPGVLFTPTLYARLFDWVNRHYRDQLAPADLADPLLLEESNRALDELTGLLDLNTHGNK